MKRVYVSGPYSAPPSLKAHDRDMRIDANIERANQAALALAHRGYAPFVPHTMMRGWEDRCRVPRQVAMGISLAWVEGCDALLVLGMSAGVRLEIAHADAMGLPVHFDIDDFPDVRPQAA
jgi:hypothetical protein